MFLQFEIGRFDAVIHFAGLKAVGESVAKPLRYYSNNLISTINLMDVMSKNSCKNVRIFLTSRVAQVERQSMLLIPSCH